ncbi:hypothetical protein ACJ41O_010674 [Fusarium nematophilum]
MEETSDSLRSLNIGGAPEPRDSPRSPETPPALDTPRVPDAPRFPDTPPSTWLTRGAQDTPSNPRNSSDSTSTIESQCPWLNDEDMNLIGDLGLPDPYDWHHMQQWAIRLIDKYDGVSSDTPFVRQRFIRPRCVACTIPCEGENFEHVIDPPVAMPCGHILGYSCYSYLLDDYNEGNGSHICPLPDCNERIFYVCGHDLTAAHLPHPGAPFYLPPSFFIPNGGYMPKKCRRCSIQDWVDRWTEEVRRDDKHKNVWVTCSGLHGIPDGPARMREATLAPGFMPLQRQRREFLQEFFDETPRPIDDEEVLPGVPVTDAFVYYYTTET